ncbi:MAG TPA: tetratricopeptide repeat protein [Rhodanobacteraceae bacterium]|nr:tetratricopeptide repeat protein [Rhodanobacteraceae bacterium]
MTRRISTAAFILLATVVLCLPAAAAAPAASPALATGDRLANDGNFKAAAQAFAQALKQAPRNAEITARLARAELLLGHAKHAVDLAEQAIAIEPANAKYQLLLGDVLSTYINDVGMFSKLGVAHRIRDAYLKAVQLAPGNADAHFSLAMYYIMAPGFAGGSNSGAEQQIQALAKLDAASADLARAQRATKAKQDAKAKAWLEQAARAASDSSGYVALGGFLTTHQQPAEALAVFRMAIQRHPADPAPYYQIGKLAAAGRADASAGIQALKTYLRMPIDWRKDDAPYAWAHYRLAQIYARTNDAAQAEAEYRQALRLNPDFQQARQALHAPPGASGSQDPTDAQGAPGK